MVGHKKEAKRCDPMGVSQKNKSRVWNKGRKRGGGDDQKNSTLTCKGKFYNGLENTYVCSNLTQAPTKTKKQTR